MKERLSQEAIISIEVVYTSFTYVKPKYVRKGHECTIILISAAANQKNNILQTEAAIYI